MTKNKQLPSIHPSIRGKNPEPDLFLPPFLPIPFLSAYTLIIPAYYYKKQLEAHIYKSSILRQMKFHVILYREK